MLAVTVVRERGGVTIDTTAYPAYLESIRERLPSGALAYASASWHYDFRDPRCPHDASLQQFVVRGGTLPEASEPARGNEIELALLGSYRDGVLTFRYDRATRFALIRDDEASPDFGEVVVDEVRLGENASCIHEIVFEHATLTIEAADLRYSWTHLARDESA
jgi:hypothetical protein